MKKLFLLICIAVAYSHSLCFGDRDIQKHEGTVGEDFMTTKRRLGCMEYGQPGL
jgi:hypothetical protein